MLALCRYVMNVNVLADDMLENFCEVVEDKKKIHHRLQPYSHYYLQCISCVRLKFSLLFLTANSGKADPLIRNYQLGVFGGEWNCIPERGAC